MTTTPTLRDQIRAALSEAGDNGVTLEDLERITGAPRKSLQSAMSHLGDYGQKWSAQAAGKNCWRHFSTEDQRDRWKKAAGRVKLSEAELKTLKTNAMKREAAHKAPPLGAHTEPGQPVVNIKRRAVGALAEGPAIETAKTRRTIDCTERPNAAWQTLVLPADPRFPPFASMRPGMDPSTGREWGR